jgi:hypothetical protein
MKRNLVTFVAIIAVIALFGVRLLLVRGGELKSPHHVPSQELAADHPEHPLALEKPDTVVTPPYHKPANLPGDWWRWYHPVAQRRGDFDTTECQDCHDVKKYCNRCHGYVGVKPVDVAEEKTPAGPAAKASVAKKAAPTTTQAAAPASKPAS